MSTEGTFEHVFMLDTALVDSKSVKNDIYIAWLDIKNGFGSIQHECIQVVMRAFGVPDCLVECIADIYKRNTTVVRTAGGVTSEIPVGRGFRQGCPLSGIVFNLVAEVLVRGVKAVHNAGYKFSCADVFAQVLMYADDGCLLASSRSKLQAQLQVCDQFADWAGIKFDNKNAASCPECWRGWGTLGARSSTISSQQWLGWGDRTGRILPIPGRARRIPAWRKVKPGPKPGSRANWKTL